MEILKTIWLVISIFSVMFTAVFLWGLIINIRRELAKTNNRTGKTVKLVYVEQVGDMFRMYDKINHVFICQHQDELELWKTARDRFPDKTIMTLKEDQEAKII